ncbi:MAG: HAMP domain-containing protein [Gammaproteobacteria bacterium]|nr:HAMP domain-containing protein [Gammaproteobacteria bacterium]MBU1653988.1 HAMP domain-containing protein [Gammaproteobacteria bacterium]MBU1960460.1 HAMP domain-containing protein [Gammaproteobacteria bacterium]
MSKEQRRFSNQIRIEKSFRLRQIRPVLLLVLFSVLTSALVFGQFYANILEQLSGGELPLYFSPEEIAALNARLPGVRETVLSWLGVLALINLLAALLAMTLATHRLAGPLHHIKRQIRQFGEGDWSGRVHLRHGDELQELAELINLTADRTTATIAAIREEITAVRGTDWADSDRVRLLRHIDRIGEQLDRFQVDRRETA